MSSISAIVVEDEPGAARHLVSVIQAVDPGIVIRGVFGSVEDTVDWINSNFPPDFAFFDIRLEDGLSFEIFRRCDVRFPVVFTTAYDQYAIEAFKVNSIDYLLKPIKESDLRFSIDKFKRHKGSGSGQRAIIQMLKTFERQQHPMSLLIRVKDRLIAVEEREFFYFHLENGIVHGRTDSHYYTIDQTMDDLVSSLSSSMFFRANRQFIVNRSAIREAEFYFNGRLSLKLFSEPSVPVLVSKARVPLFKTWWMGKMNGSDQVSSPSSFPSD